MYGAQAPYGQEKVTEPFLAGSPQPAPGGPNLWSPPRGLEPAGSLLGLLEILIARAPEEQAAGHAADGDGNATFGGDALNPMLHGGRACTLWDHHASGVF
jgi:hypothetical protein